MSQRNRGRSSSNFNQTTGRRLYSRLLLGVMLTLTCVVVASLYVQAQRSLVFSSDVLEKLEKQPSVDVIIYLNEQANLQSLSALQTREEKLVGAYRQLTAVALQSQADLIQWLSNQRLSYRPFYIVNAIAVQDVRREHLDALSRRQEINRISLDPKFTQSIPQLESFADPIDPNEIPKSLKLINVDRVWNELGIQGKGIVVAGQDTGYSWTHQALVKQYRGNQGREVVHDYNWHDAIRRRIADRPNSCGYNLQAPCDDSGHGTHTMGTIIGYDGKKERVGVAPEAQWIGCKNMDDGVGQASTYIECFEYFLAPYSLGGNPQIDGKPEKAPHVINNSWGCPSSEGCKGEEFLPIIRNLHAAGILVVASAGNDGSSCATVQDSPAFYSGELISVAALNTVQNDIAYFSSRGPSKWNGGMGPSITAPGAPIRSSIPGESNDKYGSLSGTSMAGPHVAGVVALLWSAKPELIGKIQETMDLIHSTAQPRLSKQNCGSFSGQSVPNAVFGYGLVDAYAAIQAAESFSGR